MQKKGELFIEEQRKKAFREKEKKKSEIKDLYDYYKNKNYKDSEILKAISIDMNCSIQCVRNYIKENDKHTSE